MDDQELRRLLQAVIDLGASDLHIAAERPPVVRRTGRLEPIEGFPVLPRADGKGRVVACEVLLCTPAIRNLIREGKTHQMSTYLQTGARAGMQTVQQALKELVEAGLVKAEDAQALLAQQT